jgi:hypothetical protein
LKRQQLGPEFLPGRQPFHPKSLSVACPAAVVRQGRTFAMNAVHFSRPIITANRNLAITTETRP